MDAVKVPFAIQKVGYDQNQVDRYIKKLSDEYTSLKNKYTEMYAKYDYMTKQLDVNNAAVSKAIVDAEVKAIQIITEANNEAAQIKGSAHVELVHVQQEKDRAINEIYEIVNRLRGLVPTSVGAL